VIGLQNTGVASCGGHLTIDSVLLHTQAWLLPDVRRLWLEAAQRGGDLLVPMAAGVLPRKRRRTVTEHPLRLLIHGDVAGPGATVMGNTMAQLWANLDHLQNALVAPTGVGDGTRAAELLLPDGATTLEADVHVQGISITAEGPRHLACILDLSVPGGLFE
jgi:hypothetical protein